MFGLSRIYVYGAGLLAVVMLALLIRTAGFNDGKAKADKHWTVVVSKLKAESDAKELAAYRKAMADASTRKAITDQAETKAVEGQTRIITRTRTLVQKVAQYVPPDADPVVPADLVRLFDEAAAGGDGGDAIPFAAGLTHEASAPVRLSQIGRAYVVNLGIGHQNNRTLSDLQAWVRAQEGVR